MINTIVEFDEATAFERWALDALVPLSSTQPHTAVIDVEKKDVRVVVETALLRLNAGEIRDVHVDLRPLAFGTWKVLDLLMELSLAGTHLGGRVRMTVRAKVGRATQGAGLCPPLSKDTELWRTLAGLYVATAETRHSLVHRVAEVNCVTGEVTGRDESGGTLTPITAELRRPFAERFSGRRRQHSLRASPGEAGVTSPGIWTSWRIFTAVRP